MALGYRDRKEVERLVAATERRLLAELNTALTAHAAVLRAEAELRIGDLERRVDTVHRNALRSLTERITRGAQR